MAQRGGLDLFRPQSIGDIWGAFERSLTLGLIVLALTVVLSFLAGLAFRSRFEGATLLFYIAVASLIMFAVFNRFNPAYEEAARDLGASGTQTVLHVILPIVLPSLVGVGLFGFTLSYDELARTSQSGGALNTLPLELLAMQTNATTPVIYALGTLTTALSVTVIGLSLATVMVIQRRRARLGSDAGKGMV